MKKQLFAYSSILLGVLMTAAPAFAHVVVRPAQVGIAAYQTFTMGVPNEKDTPVTSLRLLIPDGLKSVSPNVKPGWKIEVKKTGEGEDAKVTEIDWTGGSIPEGQRDDFNFSAQAPADETTLQWKAYQTYQKGDVVSWDQAPVANMTDEQREEMEKTGKGPYSQTNVINDLTGSSQPQASQGSAADETSSKTSLGLSIIAIALSAVALSMSLKKHKNAK
jgi:uncharacterized protein YcnI